jgi:hypothetical protein
MVRVRALKNHSYAGRKRKIGDIYEAPEAFVKILRLGGIAAVVPEPKPEPKYKAKVVAAAPSVTTVNFQTSDAPVREYKRRDMKAEE